MTCSVQDKYHLFLQFVLLYFATCGKPVFGQICPVECSCSKSDQAFNVARCTFRDIQLFRNAILPENTANLSINFIDSVDINEDTFKELDYTNLKALRLDNCNIGTLSENSFSHFINLITLELHSNNIDSIDTGGFYGLASLQTLNLTFNVISTLSDKAFSGLTLDTLELSHNSIPTLTAQILFGLQVSDIILKANKLPRLSSATLEPIKDTVSRITILDNGLVIELDDDTFKDIDLKLLRISHQSINLHNFLRHVETEELDLSNNELIFTDFNTYPNLISVQNADLSATGIDHLSADKLKSLGGLNELNLSHNKIFILDGNAFEITTQLHKLNLSYNPIFRVSRDFGKYLPNLKELILRGCRLAEFMDPEPFQSMFNLQVLDLRDNLIQIVDPNLEPILNQLGGDGLKMTGNRFHCNCENVWFKGWATKQDLSGVICVSPVSNIDIKSMSDEDLVCTSPLITRIEGSTEYGVSVTGSGAILEVPVNVSILLQCTGRGDPAPALQWYFPQEVHDEVVVEPGINRTNLMSTSYYRLKAIRPEQSGPFRCSAYNVVNSTDAFIEVIVRENMTIPTPSPVIPAAKATSSLLAIMILVSIIVVLIIILLITVIYKIVNREYNYHVAEAEMLNELTAVNGAQSDKPDVELLDLNSERTNHSQTEL